MTLWDEKAAKLQMSVSMAEREAAWDYEDANVRRAAVHIREDMVLVVSHLSSINSQLASIRTILKLVAVLLLAIGALVFYKL